MRASGTSSHPPRRALPRAGHMRAADLVIDTLFWLLFVADVFAGCYWAASGFGALLVKLRVLPLNSARVVALLLNGLITPVVVRGMVLLVRRRG